MNRQIIKPDSTDFMVKLKILKRYIGKRVAIVIEEIKNDELKKTIYSKPSDIFKDCTVNLSSFKFNRLEANSYD